MRMMVYNQLNGHTSTSKMRDVIKFNSQIMGMELKDTDIPSRATIEHMQLELGTLSDLEVPLHQLFIYHVLCIYSLFGYHVIN